MFSQTSKLLFPLFLLGIASSAVNAAYSISTPGTGVTWKAGENVKIDWTGTDEPKVDVRLVYGNAANLQLFAVICSDVNSADGTCSYMVANNIPSGVDYAVTVGKSPDLFGYSSFFTIQSQGPLPAASGCPNMGGNNCTASLPCCSSAGYCGATEAYCGAGCQAKYSFNGVCSNPKQQSTTTTPPPTKPTTPPPTKPTTPPTTPPTTKPTTPTPKSSTKPHTAKCGSNTCTSSDPCCSQYNFCGKSRSHCGSGCQPGKSFAGKCVAPKKRSFEKREPRRNDSGWARAQELLELQRADCHNPNNNLLICKTSSANTSTPTPN